MIAKRVLVTPLDWGLGHATRCMPIIRNLLSKGSEVVIAGSGHSLQVLQQEFPQLRTFSLPAYNPAYTTGSMVWQMTKQLLKFIKVITQEHILLEEIILKERIDVVISDNRYGCWSSKISSYFITHQTNIMMPEGWKWIGLIVNYFNQRQINKFKACLIPDTEDHFLSGVLSENTLRNVNYLGPLSRFSVMGESTLKYDILVILSGPEPQRTRLEELLLPQLMMLNKKMLMVRGVDGVRTKRMNEYFEVVDYLGSIELQYVIKESSLVISRSGYSTIMDLALLGKKAIFIPTPGQTEQEYLALRMKEKGFVYSISQNSFNLQTALLEAEKYVGFSAVNIRHNQLDVLEFLVELE